MFRYQLGDNQKWIPACARMTVFFRLPDSIVAFGKCRQGRTACGGDAKDSPAGRGTLQSDHSHLLEQMGEIAANSERFRAIFELQIRLIAKPAHHGRNGARIDQRCAMNLPELLWIERRQ